MANENLGASFSIDVTDLKAGLNAANRLIRESESEFKAAAAGMDDWTKKEAGLTAKIKSLNQITDLQQKKVNALQEQYDNLIENGLDPTSKEAVELRTKINNETAALEKNKKQTNELEEALKDFREEAEKTGKTVDEVAAATKEAGDKAEDAESGFTTLKGAVATFAGNALTSLVDGLKNAVTGLFALSQETREYRNELAKLNTSFEMAGLSGENAKSTFAELYGILGDEGAAVEAAQQLAKISTNAKDLEANTRILTGVMAQYGNSIPLEGLAEGIAATSAMGSVQGVLADALEWQGINLDEYNEKLATLTTKEERAAYIQETLTGLYGTSADAYLKNNEAVIKANKSQIEYNDTLAEMGKELEPVNAEIQELKNEFMKELIPVMKKHVIPAISNFIKKCKSSGAVEKLAEIIGWAAENFDKLAGGILLAVAAWKTMAIISTVTTAIQGATTATAALNAVMAANPIGAVITAIMALIAAVSLLTDEFDVSTTAAGKRAEAAKETREAIDEEAESFRELKKAQQEEAEQNMAQIAYVQQLNRELGTLVDENGRVTEANKIRAEFILGELNNALDTEYKLTGDVIKNYQQMQTEIAKVIDAKKAEILFNAQLPLYEESIGNYSRVQTEQAQLMQDILLQREKAAEAADKAKEALDKYNANWDSSWGNVGRYWDSFDVDETNQILQAEQQALADLEAAYASNEEMLADYYANKDAYEKASEEMLKGNTAEVIRILDERNSAFKTASSVVGEATEQQKKEFEQQVINTEVAAQLMAAKYDAGVRGITLEMVEDAQALAEKSKEEFAKVGGDITEGIGEGAESKKWTLTGKMSSLIDDAVKAAKKAAGIKSPSRLFRDQVGRYISEGIAAGVDKGTPAVVKSVKKQTNAIREAYDVDGIADKLTAAKGDFAALNASARQSANNGTGAVATGNKALVVNQYNNYKQAYTSPIEKYKAKQELFAAARLINAGAI